MVYGYARVSTKRQVLQRQIDNIKAYDATAFIFSDSFTGTTANRPQWNKLYKRLVNGDVVIFDSVSRMSRNASKGVDLYFQLYNNGIELVFLNEPHINTSVYREAIQSKIKRTGDDVDIILEAVEEYLKRLATRQIQLAFEQSEKEVFDLRKRTSEGMKAKGAGAKIKAAKTGTHYNMPHSKKINDTIKKHCKEFGGNLNDKDCIKIAECSVATFYRYKKRLIQELEVSGDIVGQQRIN